MRLRKEKRLDLFIFNFLESPFLSVINKYCIVQYLSYMDQVLLETNFIPGTHPLFFESEFFCLFFFLGKPLEMLRFKISENIFWNFSTVVKPLKSI